MTTYVTATHKRYVYGPYTCETCGHTDSAAVYVQSSATSTSNIVDGFDDTVDQAHGRAHGGAEEYGDEQIALARCPGCGQRDEIAVKNFRRKANGPLGAGLFFTLAAVAGVAFVLVKGGETEFAMFAAIFFGLPAAVALPIGLFRRLRKLPGDGVIFRSQDPRPWASAGQPSVRGSASYFT